VKKSEAKYNLDRALDDLSKYGDQTVLDGVVNWLNLKHGGSHRILHWRMKSSINDESK
jgi:hypothetical protein